RRPAAGAATLYHARRRYRRPPRIFLGRFVGRRFQSGGVSQRSFGPVLQQCGRRRECSAHGSSDARSAHVIFARSEERRVGSDWSSDVCSSDLEGQRLALQLFTMREGDIVGRREFFWEDLSAEDFNPAEFLSEVLVQYYSSADGGASVPPTDLRMHEARTSFL